MSNKIFAAVLATLALCQLSFAQVFPTLNVSRDARTMAMGGTAEADPASFALGDETVSAGVSYESWQPSNMGESIFGAGATGHFGNLGAALSFKSYGEKEYGIINDNGIQTGTFKPSESALSMGVSYVLGESFSVGAGLKLASVALAKDIKASGTAFDVFAAYRKGALRLGLSACNLGGSLDFGGGKQSLPALARVNAGYSLASSLNLTAEADYLFCGDIMGGAGAEYVIADLASVRAGYHFGSGESAIASYVSLGTGVKFAGLSFDVCLLLANEILGGSMCFGLGYSF